MFKIVNDFKNANTPMTKENKISFNLLVLQCCQYALDNIEEAEK